MPFDSDVPDTRPVEPPVELPVEPGWYKDPTGEFSHQAYWDGEQWTGEVRPGSPNRATTNAGPGWAAIVSLASGIGAFASSLPFWLVFQLFVAGGMRGGFLSSTSLSEGVIGVLLSETGIGFLLGVASILGLSALMFGGVATGSHQRPTSGHRIGRVGMILGGVGAGSTWLILALLMSFMIAEIFGG